MKDMRAVLIALAVLLAATLACLPTGEEEPATQVPLPTEARATAVKIEPTSAPTSAPPEVGTSLTVINDSQSDIHYLYVSASNAEDWGENYLAGAVLQPGEAFSITDIPDGLYDLKVEDQENVIVEVSWGMDIQGEMTWVVTGMVTLEIVNESGETITDAFISPVESTDWGENVLETVIAAGATGTLSGIPQGTYDVKVASSTGEAIEVMYNVDLTGPSSWTVNGRAPLPANAVLRFEDDFSDNRNNWGLTGESETVNYMLPSNGEYCIEIKTSDLTAWEWYEPFRPDEFVAEVVCRAEGASGATCGLGFGPDGDNLYWFEVSSSSQAFALFLLENDSWQDPLIEWTDSTAINPYGANALGIERIEGTVSVYVNGILVGSTAADRFDTGRVGLGGATYDEGGATVCMDSLRVWRLE